MKTLTLSENTSWIKLSLLILVLLFSLVASQNSYAGNPTIDQVKAWHDAGDRGSYNDWRNGNGFSWRERNNLKNWWNWWDFAPSLIIGLIENFIDSHGGPTAISGGGSGGDSGGSIPSVPGALSLATAPLFLSTSVAANVYFILDDSGSMNWETMVGGEITDYSPDQGRPKINGYQRKYLNPNWHSDNDVIPPRSSFEGAWLAKSASGNASYYDSGTSYSPWPGKDSSGNALYSNADPENTLKHPNSPSGSKVNLKNSITFNDSKSSTDFDVYLPTYYDWIDSDGDGVVEVSDSYTEVEIKVGNEALFASGNSYVDELQNFANWFQYYRKREFAAKVAIGSVIDATSATRMGLDVINDGHLRDASSMDVAANKINLLKSVYNIDSSGGTPLRRALQKVGNMFKGSTSDPSPILSAADGGSCQQNFQILMTDGYWNGYDPSVSNADGDNNTKFDGDGELISGTTGNLDGGYYADSYSKTLADVAMYYYETDLSGLSDEVPTTEGVDEAAHQHLVTYTVAFGLKGTLDPETLDPSDSAFSWPEPVSNTLTGIDDLVHAAYNGRGEYLNAAHPEVLKESLDTIISNIAERSATASAVAVNSAKLTTDTVIYLAEFNTYRWQGNIYAYPIVNLETGELAATASWEAAKVLNDRDLVTDDRAIITYDGSDGVAFRWDAISATHKNDLITSPSGGTSTTGEATARLNYIRGERSNEGSGYSFRERSSRLADIVNSGPVYVAEPDLNWPDFAPFPTSDGKKYSDYKADNATRDGIIYVGANDGMLHAFEENTGRESFAYIPNILYSNLTGSGLHYLTDTNYTHKYYNDLTPTISDVYLKTGVSDSWNTILIGGLRGGGRGIYALNVTDPSKFSEANAADMALWEFSNAHDADLGYTYSKPQIALANNGQWVAIFGNGYNDTGSGESALFIVDIEAGIDGTWSTGDYVKIKTGSGTTADINGLATPALADLDGDGTVDRVYAGDLKGQLWTFDLSSSTSSSWALSYAKPLFTTLNNRPITAKPALSFHPSVENDVSNTPNILVFFGSGQYLEDADKTDTALNHFYGVWDSGTSELTTANLVQQSIDSSYTERVLSNHNVDYATKYGWYFALTDSGERSVTSAVVRFDVVFFNTFVPTSSACSGGGYGFKMAVDSETGGALDEPVFDSNGDGVVDDNDSSSNGSSTSTIAGIQQDGYLPEPVFIEDLAFTADTATKVATQPDVKSGRMSWQELLK